ncbi:MAG: prepilin peptidase [Dehalococcoidia bacterium]|nr:prepilin peptidase [Dehalococcoidia bacterium]
MTGSFLNVIIDRLPRGVSIVHPPSHCDSCGHPLSPIDLIPVLSFLWLRGKCRYCQAKLSLRVPLVELATGIVFTLLAMLYGISLQLVMSVVYAGLFISLFVIDMEHGILPDKIVFTGMALSLGFSFLWPGRGPVNALIGGGVGLGLLLIPYVISRRGMGLGDVKLAGFLGLAAGFPSVLVALLLAILAGGAVAIVLVLFRKKGRKDAMPFGPYLVTAGLIAVLWGEPLLKWYLRLF